MPDNNARLTLHLVPVTSNREPYNYMRLTITDIASSRLVAEFDLGAEQLLELLGHRQVGSVDGVPAWLIEPDDRHALGKLNGVTTRRFRALLYDDAAIDAWCWHHASALGAHSWRFNKDNAGMYVVHWIHYLAVRDEDELADIIRRRQDTMDVIPGPDEKA